MLPNRVTGVLDAIIFRARMVRLPHHTLLLYRAEAINTLEGGAPRDYEGVIERFERMLLRTTDAMSERKKATIAEFTQSAVCPDCYSELLTEAAQTATVAGYTIGDLPRLEIPELRTVIAGIDQPEVSSIAAALLERLEAMETIGPDYLYLARTTGSPSGGESQRINAVKHDPAVMA